MGKLTPLLAILVWLQYSLWFGKNGIHDYTASINDVAAQQATNAKLKARNDQLLPKLTISMAAEALEERARNELSMTVPGETFYRLVPDASKRAQSGAKQSINQPGINMATTHLDVCVVVPAAGFGRRMQTECPKQYLSIGNQTILEHSVHALLASR